jgi:hypothetical protein
MRGKWKLHRKINAAATDQISYNIGSGNSNLFAGGWESWRWNLNPVR